MRRLLGAYLRALRAEACTREEVVLEPLHGEIVGRAPALPADRPYPKEQRLVELVSAARVHCRRVLGYVSHTGTRDLTPRLRAVLKGEGFRMAVLKADTVAPDQREEWVDALDVLLTSPRLVQTGLDYEESETASGGNSLLATPWHHQRPSYSRIHFASAASKAWSASSTVGYCVSPSQMTPPSSNA